MRICKKCGEEKEDFINNNTCRDCKRAWDRAYGKRNRKRISAYARNLWENDPSRKASNHLSKNKKRFDLDAEEFLKDKVCFYCNISNKDYKKKTGRRLDINHIDNNGRRALRNNEVPNNDTSNFMVVCRGCHVSWHNLNVRVY